MSIPYPDKRVIRTKEKFHEVLIDLMEEKNFHDITITEIVKTAGFNRGTFYAHYEKKEELLEEVIENMFDKMKEVFRKPYEDLSVINFHDFPSNSIILFDHFLEHRQFYKLMLRQASTTNFQERFSNQLDKYFREEFEFDVTNIDPNIDIELFITYRINGIIGIILQWIENDYPTSPSYMGEQLLHVLNFSTEKIYIKSKNE